MEWQEQFPGGGCRAPRRFGWNKKHTMGSCIALRAGMFCSVSPSTSRTTSAGHGHGARDTVHGHRDAVARAGLHRGVCEQLRDIDQPGVVIDLHINSRAEDRVPPCEFLYFWSSTSLPTDFGPRSPPKPGSQPGSLAILPETACLLRSSLPFAVKSGKPEFVHVVTLWLTSRQTTSETRPAGMGRRGRGAAIQGAA